MTRPNLIRIPFKSYAQELFGRDAVRVLATKRDLDDKLRQALIDLFGTLGEIGGRAELENYLEIERAFEHYVANITTVVSGNNGVFGDASDGIITFDGSTTVLGLAPSSNIYTLNRDIYLGSGSTINGGVEVRTNGFRVFCTGTLNVAGHLDADGQAPVGTTGGVAGMGTSSFYGITNQAGGGGGGFGATGAKSPGGNITANAIGGVGGAGGSASSGGTGTGTAASTLVAPLASAGGLPRSIVHMEIGGTGPTVSRYEGGTGGTSGSSAGSPAQTGAGGGAGGILGVFVQKLVNTGTLSANGGNGGPAGGASGNAGGGGGGGAGAVLVICGPDSTQGTMTATGGTGGAGRGTGGTGGSGAAGNVIFVQ